jgi:hypothetical protein
MTMVPFPAIAPCLLAAPPPQPEESLASWIQRVAGAHQYGMPRLKQALMIEVIGGDWDAPMDEDDWNRIFLLAGIEPGPHRRALRALSAIHAARPASSLLLRLQSKPCYRWCERCLATDQTPYLRWHWRLAQVDRCWTHGTPLIERCPWCQASMLVHRSRLVLTARTGCAATLAECDLCGGSLASSSSLIEGRMTSHQGHLRQLLDPFRGDGDEVMEPHAYAAVTRFVLVARAAQRREFNARRRAESSHARHRAFRQNVVGWILNADSFASAAAQVPPRIERRPRWTWPLSSEGRRAVADAMWTVRSEMRSSRAKSDGVPER